MIGVGIGIPFGRRGGIDADAAAFIAAAGITDPTQKAAINRLVKNYKGIGDINTSVDLWTGSNAIYPIVGGSATQHKFNLKNPLDTDAAFRLAFSGGWTHSANGMLGNGTNTFANTFLNALSVLSANNARMGLYIRNNVNEGRYDGGCTAGVNDLALYSRSTAGNNNVTFGLSAQTQTIATADSRGLLVNGRASATNTKSFKNGVVVLDFAQTAGLVNQPIYFGASNSGGTPSASASKQYAFGVIGQGLSDANALIEYNIIQAFQTDLARNV
jgi:hypothetical protein